MLGELTARVIGFGIQHGLCFRSRREEAEFRASLERDLARCLGLGVRAVLAIWILLVPASYFYQSCTLETLKVCNEEEPFRWSPHDARSVAFTFALLVFAADLLVVLVAQFCRAQLKGHLELFTVAVSTVNVCAPFLMSSWYTTRLMGSNASAAAVPQEQQEETMAVLWSLVCVVFTCQCMPVRAGVLWLVPFCTSLCYPILVIAVGTSRPLSATAISVSTLVICVCSAYGACMREQLHRREWRLARQARLAALRAMHEQPVVIPAGVEASEEDEAAGSELLDADAVGRALKAMVQLGAGCEAVVHLDGQGRVLQATAAHRVYFGAEMEGVPLSDVLNRGDRQAFLELLDAASATREPQGMHATLELPFGESQVQLTALEAPAGDARFVVGIHPAELEFATGTLKSAESSLVGAASSTGSANGHWREDEAFVGALRHFAEVGTQERWLVDSSEVELLPDEVLGSGGFGVVVMARYRGTAVAAKLPRRAALGGSLQRLSAAFNGLRASRHVRHANVVQFLGACVDPGTGELGFLYEMVHGARLDSFVFQWLDAGPQSMPRIVMHKLLVDMASALTYMHALSPAVSHGSLSPCNVLVEPMMLGPRAKLLSPGLSPILGSGGRGAAGSGRWTAPEVVAHWANSLLDPSAGVFRAEPPADVFSFGMLVVFVLTGSRPARRTHRSRGKSAGSAIAIAGESFTLEQCERGTVEACTQWDPGARVSMNEALLMLLGCLPQNVTLLKGLSLELSALALPSQGWDEGVPVARSQGGENLELVTTPGHYLTAVREVLQAKWRLGQSVLGSTERGQCKVML